MEANRTTETKYERLRKIGIGSYGVVFKCVNRQTGQIVAIKRYSENDSDPIIRKIAMREVRMLRQLKHPNLIQLLEVFRRKRILHLVFDYCELTVLDVIEKYANNCPLNLIRKIIWQLVNGVSHCHSHNCIHRDIKPENILINQAGVVKLCDFGFARNLNIAPSSGARSSLNPMGQREAQLLGVVAPHQTAVANKGSGGGQPQQVSDPQVMGAEAGGTNKENRELLNDRQALTEYVATRWYRAPELLVGDIYYDIKIDIWAIGCVTAELMRGEPLWPGKTDLDQLCLIRNSLGQLTPGQTHNLLTRGLYEQCKIERAFAQTEILDPLDQKLPGRVGQLGIDFVLVCLQMDPKMRPQSDELLKHPYIHSALMSQFVRGASHGPAPPSPRQVVTATSAVTDMSQRQIYGGHDGVTVGGGGRPMVGMIGSRSGTMMHRSNSQAILRVANNQQPASKRLVLEPNSSSKDGRRAIDRANEGDDGGGTGTTTAATSQAVTRSVGNSLVSVPVRGTGRQLATKGDERNYATKQNLYKRKPSHPQAQRQSIPIGQLNTIQNQMELATAAKSRISPSEPVSETLSKRVGGSNEPMSRRAGQLPQPSAQGNGSSSFGPSGSLLTNKLSSNQSNTLAAAATWRRSSDSGSSLALLKRQQQQRQQ